MLSPFITRQSEFDIDKKGLENYRETYLGGDLGGQSLIIFSIRAGHTWGQRRGINDMYSHIYPCFPFETIIDYMSIMKTWITGVVLLVLVLQVTARAKTEPRVSELTPEQMRKSICMSLSRMHIEDHMDSIEEVLDSEDEDRTMKLATILDKSFRRCMKNVELDLNKLGKSYFLGLDDKEAAGREIEKVFGEVEYEKDGKLMDPYSVE